MKNLMEKTENETEDFIYIKIKNEQGFIEIGDEGLFYTEENKKYFWVKVKVIDIVYAEKPTVKIGYYVNDTIIYAYESIKTFFQHNPEYIKEREKILNFPYLSDDEMEMKFFEKLNPYTP
jgi:hypothetical protein